MDTRLHNSSPPKLTPRGFYPHSANPVPLANARKKQLRENMEGYFLGPMDPSEFIRSFMPANSPSAGNPPPKIDFSPVYTPLNESLMYDPFVSHFLLVQADSHIDVHRTA